MPIAHLNNQGISYEDSGGNGPAVMFLHGFMFDHDLFVPQVEALAPQYRCVRFTARGFGQTQWDGNPFSLWDTVEDAIALLDHLNIKTAVFVGMSQGGYAILRIALKYPERVNGLIFIDTYNGIDTEDVKEIYRSMRDAWRDVGPAQVVNTLLTLFLGPEETNQKHWEVWKPRWEAHTAEQIAATMNNLIDRDEVSQDQVDLVKAPVMVIHGEADNGIPPAAGEALFNSFSNKVGFVRIPDAPHASNYTHPEQVNAAIKGFLTEHAK